MSDKSKSFVLANVCSPPVFLCASYQGTIISIAVWLLSTLFAYLAFDPDAIVYFLICVFIFFPVQGWMAYKTYKDPYFINVIMAKLRCRKTKNIFKTKDNVYGS